METVLEDMSRALVIFDKGFRDEHNILLQKYKGKYVWIFIIMILFSYNIIKKMHTYIRVGTENQF